MTTKEQFIEMHNRHIEFVRKFLRDNSSFFGITFIMCLKKDMNNIKTPLEFLDLKDMPEFDDANGEALISIATPNNPSPKALFQVILDSAQTEKDKQVLTGMLQIGRQMFHLTDEDELHYHAVRGFCRAFHLEEKDIVAQSIRRLSLETKALAVMKFDEALTVDMKAAKGQGITDLQKWYEERYPKGLQVADKKDPYVREVLLGTIETKTFRRIYHQPFLRSSGYREDGTITEFLEPWIIEDDGTPENRLTGRFFGMIKDGLPNDGSAPKMAKARA